MASITVNELMPELDTLTAYFKDKKLPNVPFVFQPKTWPDGRVTNEGTITNAYLFVHSRLHILATNLEKLTSNQPDVQKPYNLATKAYADLVKLKTQLEADGN